MYKVDIQVRMDFEGQMSGSKKVNFGRSKQYDKLTDKATVISDNRGHKIELSKISVEGKDDCFLHIKSSHKKRRSSIQMFKN